MWDHHTAGKLSCFPLPNTSLLLPGRDAGDGAGCFQTPARGMQPLGAPRALGRLGLELAPRLDLSLPLVGMREVVPAAARDPGPGGGGPERPPGGEQCPGQRYSLCPCYSRGERCVVPPRQVKAPWEVTLRALQLFPED